MSSHTAKKYDSHTCTKDLGYSILLLMNGLCIVTTNTRHFTAPASTRLQPQPCVLNKLKH